ncbi:MAG: bifunctional RNase H/acid phosphatase, partial [Sciscionella sp.]
GRTTNNVAEYSGLIDGLSAARDLGADSVDVRMDSKLVVEQMTGRWKIKNSTLQPLALQARELVGGFASVTFEWIPRALNKHADRLANEAMDAQAEGRPPEKTTIQDSVSHDGESLASPSPRAAPPTAWNGAVGQPTRLLLLRHGQTSYSAARRYSGRGDPELTAIGLRQARAAAHRLSTVDNLAAVVSSPLGRAVRTAEPVAAGLGTGVRVVAGLTETDFGDWEGLTFAEAAERDPRLHRRWLSDPSVATPGGESFDQVHRRVGAALDDLVERYRGGTLVVVSHVTPIKSVLRIALAAGPSVLFRLHLDLASLSIVEFYPDGNTSVRLFNDTSHLR